METISFIVLILLSLVGYSAGVVSRAGKSVELKPQIIDLILVSIIWVGTVYYRIALDLNEWLVFLVWVILSSLIGILAIWPRKLFEEKASSNKGPKETSKNLLKKLWQSWAGELAMLKRIFAYRRTVWYLLKKREIRAVYNFPCIKFC